MYNKKTIIDALRNLGNPTMPKKTAASEFEMGQEDDNWISAQNGVETPIYKKVKVAPSSIEGKGLFAEEPIRRGDVIGVSHIRQEFEKGGETYTAPFPSTVLGYYNHSEEPNVREEDKDSHVLMVAIKDIQPGEEITSNYNNHNIEDLETPDNFKKGGAKRPKLPKKANSSGYSRSLQATNRLFAQHPLFAKPRSRKNKIYDPLSKYYAKGGVTYNGLPVTYQQALENFVYPNVIDDPERTGYNSVNNTISYDSQSPIENMSNDWWREHELFHDLQNQAGGMSTSGVVGQRPNPYVASDESMRGYYDRRDADIERTIDAMIAENPDLQFIPRDILRQGRPGLVGAEQLQYSDPSTLEGEARQYEQYIREGNPSIFPKQSNGGISKRIVKRYPGMQSVYGPQGENLNVIKDPNYAAADYGFGNIEFIHPGSGTVNYSDEYTYQSPTPDKYTAVYNPKGANKHDVFLDMMHGMRNDPEYMKLLENFDKATRSQRQGDMDYFFDKDTEENPNYTADGRETWDQNYIDGQLRSQLAGRGFGRFSSGAKDYRLDRKYASKEMKQSSKDIYKYLKGKYEDGGFILDLTEDEIKQYVDGGYIVEDISVPSLTKASLGKIVKPIKPVVREVIRSNYNPITYPLKSLAEGVAKQSSDQGRTVNQLAKYLFTAKGKVPNYFGEGWGGAESLGEYGIDKRDLLANYFRQIETGFEPINYDFSADPGLESIIQEYGPLKAFKLNSQIQHGAPVDIFSLDFANLGFNNEFGFENPYNFFGNEGRLIDPNTGLQRLLAGNTPRALDKYRLQFPEQIQQHSDVVRNRLNTLFDQYGQETIPFEMGSKKDYTPQFSMIKNPVKPIDDIAGHMMFLRRNANKEFDLTTRDLWGFRPKAYNEKYDLNTFMKRKQSQLVDALGKPFVLTQTNPLKFKEGGTPGEGDCPEGFSYDAELGCVPASPDNMTEVQKWITDWYANRKIQFPEDDPQYTEGMQKVLPQYNPESPMAKQSQAFPLYKDFPTEVENTPGGYGAAGQYDTTGDVPVVWFNPELTDEKKKDVETHELTNYLNSGTADITNPINDWLVNKHVIEKDKTWPKEKKQFYDYMLDSNEQNIQSYLNVARRKFGLKPDEVVTKERLEQMRAEAEAQGMFDQNNKETFNPDIYLLFHTTKTPEGLLDWFNFIAKDDTPKANDETQYAKMGGVSEYQLGDEVDATTMKKLKELGYTFQMVK